MHIHMGIDYDARGWKLKLMLGKGQSSFLQVMPCVVNPSPSIPYKKSCEVKKNVVAT